MPSNHSKQSIFSDFTNLYALTKTLRFELKPTDETKELLKKTNSNGKNPIQVDQEIDKLYHDEMKQMYDELHLKFITESLEKVEFEIQDLQSFEENYLAIKKLSKNRKENQSQIEIAENLLADISTKLRKQVTQTYLQTATIWKDKYPEINLKQKDYKILTEKDSLLLLKEFFPEKAEIIDKFIGFHTYFTGFNQNRENYYKDEGKATEVANRIVNENLIRFIENRQTVAEIQNAKLKLENEEIFDLKNYQNLLIQSDIDEFNKIIGGENTTEGGQKIQGINEKINLWLQQKNRNLEKGDHKTKLPKLRTLYKQIGSDKKSVEIFQIQAEQEWLELEKLIQNQNIYLDSIKSNFAKFFENPDNFNLDEIYFNKASLNTISNRWFGNWFTLSEKLRKDKVFGGKIGEVSLKDISLAQIKSSLENLEGETIESLFKSGFKDQPDIYKEKCFVENNFWQTFLNIWQFEIQQNFDLVEEKIKESETKKQETFDKKIHAKWLKEICDSFLNLERMIKYNKRKGKEGGDSEFYEYIDLYLEGSGLIKYYNAFRNYISQKPFETDKIKLNFEKGELISGWSTGYDTKAVLIFKKAKKHYLGIINGTKFNNSEIHSLLENITEDNLGERLVYDFQKPDNKNTPRLFIRSKGTSFAPMVKELNLPIQDIIDIYDQGLFKVKKKNSQEHRPYLKKVIDYFKQGFEKHPSYKNYTFNWKPSEEYENIAEFYNDTASSCYKLDYEKINFNSLEKLVESGRIYLFEITNKDLKTKKLGDKHYKPNLHTTLFLELLKPKNAEFIRLLGGGELFYRSKSLEKEIDKKRSKDFEIIENKRYTDDKFFLHFPIELRGNKLKGGFKDKIQDFISKNKKSLTYLGIDRGEKHLMYYSLLDWEGKILKDKNGKGIQGSFNVINDVPYHEKLSDRADNMMQARQNWETIGNIKNFKEGYLSQVVHEIYQMVIEHNSLIIMEDLNTEFKAKRTAKVEKSVYKKFELALAKKLNYLVLKDKKTHEEGGVLKAYQLTPYIAAGDIGKFEKAKQWGVLQYVRAAYTSTTDPLTDWRKRKYISNSAQIPKIKEFFNVDTGVKINWDEKHACFKFSYNWESEENGEKKTGFDELFAFDGLERFRWDPKYPNSKTNMLGAVRKIKLYQELQSLFEELDKTENINQQIQELENFNWKSLVFYWNLLNQIRNTDRSGLDDSKDFIQSPTYSEKIEGFFDSRKIEEYKQKFGLILPENGDANGAYHIAKRGLELIN
jgi:hypothetical protein